MENLMLDLGIREYRLTENGVLRFNPSDPNVYERFLNAEKDIHAVEDEAAAKGKAVEPDAENMGESAIRIMAEADRKIKDILNRIFRHGNDFHAIFEGVNVLAVNGTEAYYQEINPALNTETRIAGINALLNQIGYKCGFSNGHFVFNEKTGIQTATQVEADQQRTIQFIKDVRDKLESCIGELVFALNAFADLYNLAPSGSFKIEDAVHFADITYSFEADKLQHYQMAVQGHYPWEEYYVRFLKYSREEARELLRMAKAENKAPALFGGYE